ncbi:hypothetical protein HYX16_02475 [Candidatus Woesearchaeota archaeon]|nr:hypothetical protein [Candidatus Woesearchaeota archaeon]
MTANDKEKNFESVLNTLAVFSGELTGIICYLSFKDEIKKFIEIYSSYTFPLLQNIAKIDYEFYKGLVGLNAMISFIIGVSLPSTLTYLHFLSKLFNKSSEDTNNLEAKL